MAARVDLILLSWLLVPVAFNLRHSLDLHLHFFALILPAAYLVIGRSAQALFDATQGMVFGRVARIGGMVGAGVLVLAEGPSTIRAVTSLMVDRDDVKQAIEIIRKTIG